MIKDLSIPLAPKEVYKAMTNMKAKASPGPNVTPALFYQFYWEIVGKDITNVVLNILNNKGRPMDYNHTYICLIPKPTILAAL